jgi:hypothetical protein
VYIIEYLTNVEDDINVPPLWEVNSIEKFEGEVFLGKGRWTKVKGINFNCNYYPRTDIINLNWNLNHFLFLHPSCEEWDALHLYIVNSLDWMKVWIE